MSGTRVGSGTCASSAWRTIGASTPSMSSSTPARVGSARKGAIASVSVAPADTALVWRVMAGGRILELGAIGTAAGLFSGLFGVGIAAIPGAVLGVTIVNVVPEHVVEIALAGRTLVIAWQ